MAITALPTPPSRSDPVNFSTRADAFLGALSQFVTEANTLEAAAAAAANAVLTSKVTGPASATDNAIARFDSTTGKLVQNSSATIDDAGNVGFGVAPEERLDVHSATNEFALQLRNNSSKSWVWGVAADRIYLHNKTDGVNVLRVNNNGNLEITGGTLGYGAGSGGTVTQATSKATAVTLNKPSGRITMHNAALAAGALVTFELNNSTFGASDTLSFGFNSGASAGAYSIVQAYGSGGLVGISLRNVSSGSLSEALVIQFNIIKGSTT